MKKENEKWKYVPGIDGVMVSSLGRIVKQPSYAPMYHGGFQHYKPKPTYGYVTAAKKGAAHEYRGIYFKGIGNVKIHRAVCMAFHGPAPKGKPVVIHIDENAHNNRPENLKWGTQKENLNSPGFIEYCKGRTGDDNPFIKGRKAQEGKAA